MSVRLVSLAFGAGSQLELKNAEFLVLLKLAEVANDEGGRIWASNDYVGHFTNLHANSVSRAIKTLVRLGLVERKRRVGTSSLTTIVVDELEHHNRLRQVDWDTLVLTHGLERDNPRSNPQVKTCSNPRVKTVQTPGLGTFKPPGSPISELDQLAEQTASNREPAVGHFDLPNVSAAIASVSDLNTTLQRDARAQRSSGNSCTKCDGHGRIYNATNNVTNECPQCTPF